MAAHQCHQRRRQRSGWMPGRRQQHSWTPCTQTQSLQVATGIGLWSISVVACWIFSMIICAGPACTGERRGTSTGELPESKGRKKKMRRKVLQMEAMRQREAVGDCKDKC